MGRQRAVPDERKSEFLADFEQLGSTEGLAKKWGIHVVTARATLKRFGVGLTPGVKRKDYGGKLGIVPDVVLAEELGVSVQAVWEARTKRGIPSHKERAILERYGVVVGQGR